SGVHSVKAISFPDYNNPSSALVKMYLGGELSKDADGVNAYAASSFYAVDRYASYKMFWEGNYKKGDLILASRYVSSNAIHQMVKLDESRWDSYLKWLSDYEYVKLGLPVPD
ncbi:MAG: thymidylate kinase, partial [Oscillospiraceae bacterium]|nr:thymidylate kinase [Oscillospiraceae bacterium]